MSDDGPVVGTSLIERTTGEDLNGDLEDYFAGGGGASEGILSALGRSPTLAINHNPHAIQQHALNHPSTVHLHESVWDMDLSIGMRGDHLALAWLSPDCRHYSRAKGRQPVSREIRGLAWMAVRVGACRDPDTIILENVQEFTTWGPLVQRRDERGELQYAKDGKPWMVPDPEREGETFRAFISALTTGLRPEHPAWEEARHFVGRQVSNEVLRRGLGYQVGWRVLDAADFGAATHRKRLVLIARRPGLPIVWPEPSHGPGRPLPYRDLMSCLDPNLPNHSVFLDRMEARRLRVKRPLSDDCIERLSIGVRRYVLDPDRSPDVVQLRDGSLSAVWVAKHYTGVVGHRVDRPIGTITQIDHHSLVQCRLVPAEGPAHDRRLDVAALAGSQGMPTVRHDGKAYVVADCAMRMLSPRELANCQGFPASYQMIGSQDEQMARIGNSVPPPLAAAVIRGLMRGAASGN